MTSRELAFMSATELGRVLRDKEASPVEAVEAYLERIEQLNPSLNAYITVLADDAMASARQAEAEIAAGRHKGPLHGVPVGVKDQIHTEGILTTDASKIRADFIPDRDATVVANLKRAGAVILGKLNMTEFAMGDPITSAFGVTRNPWDASRSPGTSSTGSGAATAAFMCATSLGEDTGGSVRGPAANCGLVGLRPSWGRVSRFGVDGASWSLDTIGPISRTVEDCAATIGAIAGHDANDPYTWESPVPDYREALTGSIHGTRVGVVRELTGPEAPGLDDQTRRAVLTAAEKLAELGAEVEEVSIPLAARAGVASRVISSVERVSLRPDWIRDRPQDFHHNTRIAFMTGEVIPAQTYYKAQKLRTLIRRQALEALERYDVLAMPTTSGPAAVMDLRPGIRSKKQAAHALQEGAYRGFFSMVSGPALSICCGFTSEGERALPLALQLAGRPFDESTVLRVAHAYEQNTPWHNRRPPV